MYLSNSLGKIRKNYQSGRSGGVLSRLEVSRLKATADASGHRTSNGIS
jgi:hypothetical protein